MNYSFCCLLMVQFSPGLSETRQKWAEAGIRSLTSHGHHTALHPWHVPGAREDRGGWTGRGQVKISIYWLCSQNLVVWWNAFVSREINLVSQSCHHVNHRGLFPDFSWWQGYCQELLQFTHPSAGPGRCDLCLFIFLLRGWGHRGEAAEMGTLI